MVLAPAAPAISTAPVLTVTAVGKSYGARAVLADVSFSVAAGERIALTGPSGSGKTTLLNCLGGVDRPDTGTIALHGERIDALPSDGLARLLRELTDETQTALVLVTHSEEAAAICHRRIHLRDGRVVA